MKRIVVALLTVVAATAATAHWTNDNNHNAMHKYNYSVMAAKYQKVNQIQAYKAGFARTALEIQAYNKGYGDALAKMALYRKINAQK